MKRLLTILTVGLTTLTISGCFSTTSEELLQAPKLPTDYLALQNQIDKEISNGKVLASPDYGTNRNTLQLKDLDADSEEEAIAFFRLSNISNEFEVVVYEKDVSNYREVGRIDGQGTGIYSVDYPRLSPVGGGGIIITWSLSDKLQKGLTVVKYENESLTTLLNTTFEQHFIYDIDKDGIDEIFVINREDDKMFLKMYDTVDDKMSLMSTALLSTEVDTISKITIGKLVSGGVSISIDSRLTDKSGLITDFITYDDGKLINITMDESDSSYHNTYRVTSSNSAKLSGDETIYIPSVTPMIDSEMKEVSAVSYVTNWKLFDNYNPLINDLYTYHNTLDSWYFVLSDTLKNNITVDKSSISSSMITKFSYYVDEDDKTELFEVYMIPKDDFNNDSFGNGYINLATNTNYVYVAKNLNPKSEYALTNDEISENFNIIGS